MNSSPLPDKPAVVLPWTVPQASDLRLWPVFPDPTFSALSSPAFRSNSPDPTGTACERTNLALSLQSALVALDSVCGSMVHMNAYRRCSVKSIVPVPGKPSTRQWQQMSRVR